MEHLPRHGPLLIASRHAHHLYDGCLLLAVVPRPLHLLVALDWVATRRDRRVMEWACHTAQWPVVLRAERLQPRGHSTYGGADAGRYLRRAVRDAVTLLRAGRALALFPEAYPTVDSHATPQAGGDALLPFRPGFIRIVEMAQRDGRTRVPIVPAGVSYRPGRRWQATLRFAAPLSVDGRAERARVLRVVEEQARQLSTSVPACRHKVE
jgi:putative membrane protein